MLSSLLAIANFGLATYDAYHTQRVIKKFGVGVETNGLIRKLSTLMGPVNGTLVAICGLAAVEGALFAGLNWPIPLAVLVGMRLKLLQHQLLSRHIEKEAARLNEELRKNLEEKGFQVFGKAVKFSTSQLGKEAQKTLDNFKENLIRDAIGGASKSATLPDLKSDEASAPPSPSK